MAYEKGQKVLAEARDVAANVKRDAGLSTKTSIRADLLNADVHAFSTDVIDYNSVSAAIIEENEELFALSRCCDPFAPQYLTICKTLTKTIEHLGSVFLTKTSMSILNYDTTGLEKLTIDALLRMVSFNFRKVHDTLQRKKKDSQEFDIQLYEQMLSFAKVLRRLGSTETKAVRISLGLDEPYPHMNGIKKNKNKANSGANQSSAPLRELPSYPIHYEAFNQDPGTRGQGQDVRDQGQGAGAQNSGSRDQGQGASRQVPVNNCDNTQAAETGLDDAPESHSDSCEGSETELPENIEPSRQESTPSVSSEEENSGEAAIPAEDDFDERFAQLPDAVKACVVSIIDNPDNLKNYLMCLADENYCRIYREKTDIFREAIAFLNNALPQKSVDSG